MVYHLDAVARRVSNEDPPGFRIEHAVVESAAYRVRNVDDPHSVQRHGGLPSPCCRISETCLIEWSGGPFMRNLLEPYRALRRAWTVPSHRKSAISRSRQLSSASGSAQAASVLGAVCSCPLARVRNGLARRQNCTQLPRRWQTFHPLAPPAECRVFRIHGFAFLREAEGKSARQD